MSAEPLRYCNRASCRKLLVRKPREAIVLFNRRRYCDRTCSDACSSYRPDKAEAKVEP